MSCLKQEKLLFTQENVVNIDVAYEINSLSNIQGADFVLGNYFFAVINLIKNAGPDKYKYSDHDLSDARKFFVIRW